MMPFLSSVPAIVTIHDVGPFLKYTDKRGLHKHGNLRTESTLRSPGFSHYQRRCPRFRKRTLYESGVPESKVKVAPCGVGSYLLRNQRPIYIASTFLILLLTAR